MYVLWILNLVKILESICYRSLLLSLEFVLNLEFWINQLDLSIKTNLKLNCWIIEINCSVSHTCTRKLLYITVQLDMIISCYRYSFSHSLFLPLFVVCSSWMKVKVLESKDFLSWKSWVHSSLVIGVQWIVVKVSYQTLYQFQNQIIVEATYFGMKTIRSKDDKDTNIKLEWRHTSIWW